MSAGEVDITIEPGADFEEVFVFDATPTDGHGNALNFWVGWTAAAQVRHRFSDTAAALELVVDLSTVLQIAISAPAADTNALQDSFRKGVWDCELTKTSGGDIIRLFQGHVRVNPQVTQSA